MGAYTYLRRDLVKRGAVQATWLQAGRHNILPKAYSALQNHLQPCSRLRLRDDKELTVWPSTKSNIPSKCLTLQQCARDDRLYANPSDYATQGDNARLSIPQLKRWLAASRPRFLKLQQPARAVPPDHIKGYSMLAPVVWATSKTLAWSDNYKQESARIYRRIEVMCHSPTPDAREHLESLC